MPDRDTPKRKPVFIILKTGFFITLEIKNYLLGVLIAACAAARRAIGTRKGEQDT